MRKQFAKSFFLSSYMLLISLHILGVRVCKQKKEERGEGLGADMIKENGGLFIVCVCTCMFDVFHLTKVPFHT